MTDYDWQPAASLDAIRLRAELYCQLRDFFAERGVLEIEVPVMAAAAVTDPNIEAIRVTCGGQQRYLQTSPEYFMKRLLAAGSGPIFSLGKAFRDGEVGRRHNPEFTMLEWYRPGWNEQQLIGEVEQIIRLVLPELPWVKALSYREVFQQCIGIDPHKASLQSMMAAARERVELSFADGDRDTWLDILMTHVIEPQLGDGLTFIYDFPASQCALAKVMPDAVGQPVAKRFEAYARGMELANGYWELTDSQEQSRRFARDLERRKVAGRSSPPLDLHLLLAIESGLPECAGVALGVDRLLMLAQGASSLAEVLAFPFGRA